MAEKNIFAYKLFLSLNISDFNLLLMWKLQPPSSQKSHPLLTSSQAPPLYGGGGGVHTMPSKEMGNKHKATMLKKWKIFTLVLLYNTKFINIYKNWTICTQTYVKKCKSYKIIYFFFLYRQQRCFWYKYKHLWWGFFVKKVNN